MEQILSELRSYEGVSELHPSPGSEHPDISWGDHFFYYAPDGRVPTNRQPYATIVTKNYPGDVSSHLDEADRWRLNIHVERSEFSDVLGYPSTDIEHHSVDYTASDVFTPHPVYGGSGWISVVCPGICTLSAAKNLLRSAHEADRRRVERRRGGHRS